MGVWLDREIEVSTRPLRASLTLVWDRERSGAGRERGDAAAVASEIGADARTEQTGRILIADDEQSMRLLLSVNLGLAGFDVVEAANGTEALAKAASNPFDLAVLDVMMPDVNGHEVARELRRSTSTASLPVVFLSARTSRDDLRAGYELGGLEYITKPFDPIAVSTVLTEVLDRVRSGTAEQVRLERLEELARA